MRGFAISFMTLARVAFAVSFPALFITRLSILLLGQNRINRLRRVDLTHETDKYSVFPQVLSFGRASNRASNLEHLKSLLGFPEVQQEQSLRIP